MRNCPVLMISDNDTASHTGSAIFVGQAVAASVTNVFKDATAAGTIKIQGSNDIPVGAPDQYTPASDSWNDITSATSAISSGVGPAIVLQTMNFQYVRAVYTRASGGSTTMTVTMSYLAV